MTDRLIIAKSFVLDDNGKILVLRRSITDQRRPLTWDLPGGIVELDEDPDKAVAREIYEEAGLKTTTPKIFHVDSRTDKAFLVFLLYFLYTNDKDVSLSFEHDIYLWVSKDEFMELNIPELYKTAVEKLPHN